MEWGHPPSLILSQLIYCIHLLALCDREQLLWAACIDQGTLISSLEYVHVFCSRWELCVNNNRLRISPNFFYFILDVYSFWSCEIYWRIYSGIWFARYIQSILCQEVNFFRANLELFTLLLVVITRYIWYLSTHV